MKILEYTVKDEFGLHARPAGELVKEVKKYKSEITIISDGKQANAAKLMMLMSLGIKRGVTITVTVKGVDEETAAEGIGKFLSEIL